MKLGISESEFFSNDILYKFLITGTLLSYSAYLFYQTLYTLRANKYQKKFIYNAIYVILNFSAILIALYTNVRMLFLTDDFDVEAFSFKEEKIALILTCLLVLIPSFSVLFLRKKFYNKKYPEENIKTKKLIQQKIYSTTSNNSLNGSFTELTNELGKIITTDIQLIRTLKDVNNNFCGTENTQVAT